MSSVVLISAVVFRLVSSHGVRFSLCHPFRLVSQNSRHFFHRYLAPIGPPSSIAPLLVVSWRMEGARARRRRRKVNEGGGRVGKGVIEGGGWRDLAVTRWGRAMEREGRACRSRRGRGCLRARPRRHEVGEGEEKGRGGVVVVVVRAGEGTTSSSRVVSGVLTYYTFTGLYKPRVVTGDLELLEAVVELRFGGVSNERNDFNKKSNCVLYHRILTAASDSDLKGSRVGTQVAQAGGKERGKSDAHVWKFGAETIMIWSLYMFD
ncbi:hypothetical protein EV363DRAFT_1422824 [Boletus edulis]|nr:hypothetical protein EV363DRAFT_1422824 [Boletus edulis]